MALEVKKWKNILGIFMKGKNEKKLKEDGYFNHKVIREKWNEHLNGNADWHHQLWNVLVFQAWLENNR